MPGFSDRSVGAALNNGRRRRRRTIRCPAQAVVIRQLPDNFLNLFGSGHWPLRTEPASSVPAGTWFFLVIENPAPKAFGAGLLSGGKKPRKISLALGAFWL